MNEQALNELALNEGDGVEVFPTSIASEEAFGTPTLDLVVSATSIASEEAFGTPTLTLYVEPAGIPSGEAVGTPTIAVEQFVDPSSIPSAEAFGAPAVAITIVASGIASGEVFGTPDIDAPGLIRPTGISSGERFGRPRFVTIEPFVIPETGLTRGQTAIQVHVPAEPARATLRNIGLGSVDPNLFDILCFVDGGEVEPYAASVVEPDVESAVVAEVEPYDGSVVEPADNDWIATVAEV